MATSNQTKTIVGVFNSVQDAHAAVREIEAQGISRDDVSVVANKNATGYDTMEDRDKTSDVVADAGIGAAIGGVGGLLLSAAGALTIPVIGPILAAGPIAAALTGAGIGAAAGGFVGALTESGIPEQDAKHYAEGVRRGDVLVTIRTDERNADAVCDVLDRHHAVDVDDRVQNWRTRGWTGWNDNAQPYTSDELRQERSHYRQGKDPSVSGQVGGIGHEGLPTPYDEREDRSTIGTTGMSGAGLAGAGLSNTGGTSSGYAGQPSGHVSGRDLSNDPRDRDRDGFTADDRMRDAGRTVRNAGHEVTNEIRNPGHDRENDRDQDRGYGSFASGDATNITGNSAGTSDYRDRDRDGYVADDRMREGTRSMGQDVKDTMRDAGHAMRGAGHDAADAMRDVTRTNEHDRSNRAAHDPRDRDRDGWVADDTMRDAGTRARMSGREMVEDVKDLGRTREHDESYGGTRDPRDRDRDGWVADDKMRDASDRMHGSAREMKEDVKDLGRTREHDRSYTGNRDPRDKDADGWTVDDKLREWGRDIKNAVTGAGHQVSETGRELRDEARSNDRHMTEAERRRRARVYDRTII